MTGNWRPSGLVSQKGEAKQVPKTKGAQPDLRRQEPDSDQRRAGWQKAGQAWNLPGMRSAFSQQWYSNCVHLKNCVSDMPGVVSDLNLQIPCPAKMSLFLHSMWWVKTSKQGSKQTGNWIGKHNTVISFWQVFVACRHWRQVPLAGCSDVSGWRNFGVETSLKKKKRPFQFKLRQG